MATKKTTTKKLPTFGEIWICLSKVNVNKYLQKKGKFDYLPWGDAWAIMMEHFPNTTFENHLNDNGYPAFYDPKGRAMVRVTVTVCGHSHTEDYMVTNYSNYVIDDPDPSQINNCLKRALVKCLAYFGLGSYLYNQIDMLEEDNADPKPEPVMRQCATDEQVAQVKKRIEDSLDPKDAMERTLKWANVDKIGDISVEKATLLLQAKS
tara:strand:+ start:3240 stop:3860 length:621 start_codon:yes stop_codon:yes gene_type:complete